METLLRDLKVASRELLRRPSLTFLICGSLALAIAANTTVFSLIEALVLRPFHYPEADRLGLIWQAPKDNPDNQDFFSAANFMDLRREAQSFEAIEGASSKTLNLTGGDRPEGIKVVCATPGMLNLLGAQPVAGRLFRPEEAHAGQDHVALLTYQLWQRRFGGRADIVGSAVQLDDESYSVVGVLPESFEFIMIDAGFWVPLSLEGELSRDRRDIVTMARLKPGVRYEAAQAELKGIADRLAAAYPEANRGLTLSTQNLRKEIPGKTDRQLLSLMQGAMLLVLLIACANIANLLLARGQDRQREFALRTTLGARRRTMLRQLLTESLLMALLGGLAGIGIGLVLQDGLNKMVASEIPKMMLPRMSLPVLGFTAGVTVLAAALFGLFPALISTRPQLASTLKDGARGSSLGGRKRLVSRGLVVAEVALALVMLCGTGLLVRSIVAVKNLNAGFDTSHLLTFSLNLPPSRYKEDAQVANGYTQAVEKLAALPGVRAAAVVENLPRSRNNPTAALTFEGKPLAEGATPPQVISLQISPRYFDVLGIRLLQGRALGAGDHAGSEPVVVVSQAFAKKYLEGASPLGQRLLLDGKAVSVAGVVADVVQSRIPGTKEVAQPIVYRPHAQLAKRTMSVMLRTERTPDALGEGVRQAIAALDPSLPVEAVRSLEENIALEFAGARAISLIVGGFGLVALLLSALGIYGVVAYSVAQRTHEIGVRIAIGARHSSVVSMVTRQGLVLTGIGLLVGLPGVYLVSRAVDATLEGVASSHQGTLPLIAVALAAVAALASYLPARRAATVDPIEALKGE